MDDNKKPEKKKEEEKLEKEKERIKNLEDLTLDR